MNCENGDLYTTGTLSLSRAIKSDQGTEMMMIPVYTYLIIC